MIARIPEEDPRRARRDAGVGGGDGEGYSVCSLLKAEEFLVKVRSKRDVFSYSLSGDLEGGWRRGEKTNELIRGETKGLRVVGDVSWLSCHRRI